MRHLLVGAGLGPGAEHQCRHVAAGRDARRKRARAGATARRSGDAGTACADRCAVAAPSGRRSRRRAGLCKPAARAGAPLSTRRRRGAARGRGADEPASLRLVAARRHRAGLDARHRAPARPCRRAAATPPGCAPLPHPPVRDLAPSRTRAGQRRHPARCGARIGPPAAHAGAHRHARRALRCGDPRQSARDRGRPALSRRSRCARRVSRRLRRAQPPLPVGRGGDGRQPGAGPAGSAGRMACGVRAERPRPGHRDRAAVRGAAVLHAGALRRLDHAARRHPPARRTRAIPAGDVALRTRHGLCAHRQAGRRATGTRTARAPRGRTVAGGA